MRDQIKIVATALILSAVIGVVVFYCFFTKPLDQACVAGTAINQAYTLGESRVKQWPAYNNIYKGLGVAIYNRYNNDKFSSILQRLQKNIIANMDLAWVNAVIADPATQLHKNVLLELATHPKANAKTLYNIVKHPNADFFTDFAVVLHKNVAAKALEKIANRIKNEGLLMLLAAKSQITSTALVAIAKNANSINSLQAILSNNTNKITPKLLSALANNPVTDLQLLTKLLKNYRQNDQIDIALVQHPHTNAAILINIAKRTKNPEVLQKIIAEPRAGPAIIAAVVKNPVTTATILQDIVNLNIDELAVAKDITSHPQTTTQTLELIAIKTANAALLAQIARDPRADQDCLMAVLSNPKVNAKILQLLAEHSHANQTLYNKILTHPKIAIVVLDILSKKSQDLNFLKSVTSKQQVFAEITKKQQQNLTVMMASIQNTIPEPRLANPIYDQAGKFYLGLSILPTVIFDYQENYGNQVFNKKNIGADIYVGYLIKNNIFLELGLQHSVTRGGAGWIMAGSPFPGNIVEPMWDFRLATKIKQQVTYLAIGIQAPINLLSDTEFFILPGLAALKFVAKYDVLGNQAVAEFPKNLIAHINFKKEKIVPMFKLGFKHRFTNNWGMQCSGSWFNTRKIAIISREAPGQMLKLSNSYTVGLGLWYLF